MAPLMVRWARPTDDLSPLLGTSLAAQRWNPAQTLVAEEAGELVGMVLVWDAGHPVCFCDHLVTRPSRRPRVTWALIRALQDYARERGIRTIVALTGDVQLAAVAQRRGVQVSAPCHALAWTVNGSVAP
jgi:GNAT superfamily N-acetyltransferase